MNRYFTKENIHVANRHMEKCISLVTRESRTTKRYQDALIEVVKMETEGSKYWQIWSS